jgi:glycosyltransferase involved in cell wall biosynthesis
MISVIICTHNPRRDYFARTLESLRAQDLPQNQWELIVVDNDSKESVADIFDLTWHEKGRVVVESELGLTPARLRGIEEAAAEIVVFSDDDNILEPDYLSEVIRIFDEQPRLGCIGAGILTPEFESEPLPETRPYLAYLALREVEKDYWGNQITGMIPWGAGLSVRKGVAEAYLTQTTGNPLAKALDRRGDSLISGGDDEFSHVAVKNGWGIGIFLSLKITHLISSRRLTKEYLEKMVEANGTTRAFLAHVHGESLANPFRPPSFRRLIGLVGKSSLKNFLKAVYGYFVLLGATRFDRKMAQLKFDGWNAGIENVRSLE